MPFGFCIHPGMSHHSWFPPTISAQQFLLVLIVFAVRVVAVAVGAVLVGFNFTVIYHVIPYPYC